MIDRAGVPIVRTNLAARLVSILPSLAQAQTQN